MQRDVVNFDIDVPKVIRLDKGPEGTKRANGQFQHILNQNKAIMWLPQAGQEALMKSGARAGDDVELTKTVRDKAACFAARVITPPVVTSPPTHACRPRTNGHTENADANAQLQAELQRVAENHFQIPEEPQQVERAISPTALHLMSCLCAAIDAAGEAQEYGRRKGLGLTFLGCDIRARVG